MNDCVDDGSDAWIIDSFSDDRYGCAEAYGNPSDRLACWQNCPGSEVATSQRCGEPQPNLVCEELRTEHKHVVATMLGVLVVGGLVFVAGAALLVRLVNPIGVARFGCHPAKVLAI